MSHVVEKESSRSATPVRTHGLFIDGKQVEAHGKGTLDVLNPANGEVIARISHADESDVDRAVQSARRAFEGKAVVFRYPPIPCAAIVELREYK